jgi:hypothetical protein
MSGGMRQSESIAKLAAALVKAQAEIQHANKNAKNLHFKTDYADLAEQRRAIKPAMGKHGLAVVQLPGMDGDNATLETMLIHESGEWIAGTSASPMQKQDPQGLGSATTYLRRYSLAALAFTAQDDDDGALAGIGPTISAEQIATLEEWIEESGADRAGFLGFVGVKQLADLPAKRYDFALGRLRAKKAGGRA